MTTQTVRCPECGYLFAHVQIAGRGSYSTSSDFLVQCAHRADLNAPDALTCPTLLAAVERQLGLRVRGASR